MRLKKKIDDELEHYFPAIFDDATIKEFYDELKRRTIAILDSIIHGTDNDTEIERITDGLITYSKPKSFGGSDNAEIAYDKQFEKMCLMLSQHLHIRPKDMSVLEFYNAFEMLKDMAKRNKNAK